MPSSGGLVPEHDYDDVAMEEEMSKETDEVQLRKRSKLTPPVESTYSIIGEEVVVAPPPANDDQYSHLHSRTVDGEERGGEIAYSSLSSPDPPSKSISADNSYSSVSDRKPLRRGDNPPSLPVRPRTTYDRVKGRPSLSSPSPVQADEEVVSKQKFDIIMGQLRKIQVCVLYQFS